MITWQIEHHIDQIQTTLSRVGETIANNHGKDLFNREAFCVGGLGDQQSVYF